MERLLNGRSPAGRMNPVYAIATVQRITAEQGSMGDHLVMRQVGHMFRTTAFVSGCKHLNLFGTIARRRRGCPDRTVFRRALTVLITLV